MINMKTKMILDLTFAAFILTAAFSGCIGNDSKPIERDQADIQSVTVKVNGSDVVATIVTELDHDERLDTDNIKVNTIGNTFLITVLTIENSADTGSNIVDVKLGSVSNLNDGTDYSVIANGENDNGEGTRFRFESGTLVTFEEAFVSSVTFETDGKNIVAVVEIPNVDNGTVVDEQNITKTRFDHENEMNVFIPLKITAGTATDKVTLYTRVVVGQTDQLSNGRYSVEINDRDAYFTIQNGTLA